MLPWFLLLLPSANVVRSWPDWAPWPYMAALLPPCTYLLGRLLVLLFHETQEGSEAATSAATPPDSTPL